MIASGGGAEIGNVPEPRPETAEAARALTVPAGTRAASRPRRSLRALSLALAIIALAGIALWQAPSPELAPAPAPASLRDAEARAGAGGTGGTGQPAQELAAVLDILYRNPVTAGAEPSPAQGERRGNAPPATPEKTRAAQQRLAEIGYLRAAPGDTWSPEANEALREFKTAQGLGPEPVLDETTEKALYDLAHLESAKFVGVWAPEIAACAPRNRTRLLTAVINHKGAWAGDVSCSFAEPKREGDTWSFAAVCSRGRNRWTSNVRLTPTGDALIWSSERGTQRYLRCPGG
jgi:hypothetical protein